MKNSRTVIAIALSAALAATVGTALVVNHHHGSAQAVIPPVVWTGPVGTVAPTVQNAALASSIGPNIVGGSPASPDAYPFEASLLLDRRTGDGPQFHCGATLIAKLRGTSWYETQAHCVTDDQTPSAATLDPAQLTIATGSSLRSEQTTYPVDLVVAHPDWNWGITTGPGGRIGDIALVRVPQVVPEQPALIGADRIGQTVRLIGWGLTTQAADGDLPDGLIQLDTHVVPDRDCAASEPTIGPGETCLLNPDGAGPCFGDSGSAALRSVGDRYELVGSTSRGVGDASGRCGVPGDDDIVTTTASYLPFMLSTILGSSWARHHTVRQGIAVLSAA